MRNLILVAMLVSCARPITSEAPRWETMSTEAKMAYMTDTVMSEMREVFAQYDQARFARMSCATCHGHDAERRGWAMPNPDLLIEPEDLRDSHTRMNVFMRAKVAPRMAELLHQPSPGDCLTCHTLDH